MAACVMSPETVEKTVSSVHPGSLIVKGQSNEIFDPQFFYHLNLPDQWVKTCSTLVKNSLSYLNFKFKDSRGGIRLWGVEKVRQNMTPGSETPASQPPRGSDTPGSQFFQT